MAKVTRSILIRKIIHILTAIIPLIYIYSDRYFIVSSLAILGISVVLIDFARLEIEIISNFIEKVFGKLMWEREKNNLTGATHYAIAAFLSVYFFDKWIAIAVLLFLSFGDTAAHLIGVRWGRTRFDSEKTLEGSGACLVICLGISLLIPQPEITVLTVGAVVASVVELIPLDIDDNLTLPLISGVAMEILLKI